MLQALFLSCAEEAGCLLFRYDAGRQQAVAVWLQPVMGTGRDAAKAPFSLQQQISDTLALNLGIHLKILEKQSRTSNRSPGQYNKSSCKHNYPAAVSECGRLEPVQVFLPRSMQCHVGDSSYSSKASGYERHLTRMMKTLGYRQG